MKKPLDKTGPSGLPDFDSDDGEGTNTDIRVATHPPPSSARDRPFLVVLDGRNVGEMFALKHSDIVIGRGQNATIRIEDDGVSRRHAKLTLRHGDVSIEDLKSANGTFVNGESLNTTRLLRDGDKITLGTTTILKFTFSDELEVTFQRRMLEAALRDGTTGAFNKRYFVERLTTELAFALRHRAPLSLVMFDVDHFKQINDTHGHPAGDAVLAELARVVRETLRKEDVFARYGGEEFAILCRSVTVADAGVLAERLRERVGAMVITHEGEQIRVTISLGVAGYPSTEADSPEKLVAAADGALYEAKQAGRNCVVRKS